MNSFLLNITARLRLDLSEIHPKSRQIRFLMTEQFLNTSLLLTDVDVNIFSVIDPENSPKFVNNPDFVAAINNVQKSWTATQYRQFEDMTVGSIHRMLGGPKSRVIG